MSLAYLDPGSGSLIASVLVGGAAAAGVAAKQARMKLGTFGRKKKTSTDESAVPVEDDAADGVEAPAGATAAPVASEAPATMPAAPEADATDATGGTDASGAAAEGAAGNGSSPAASAEEPASVRSES